LEQERVRLRPPRVATDKLALRLPARVGPMAEVFYDGCGHSLLPEAAVC
jgi:hypothetical protein